MKKISKILLMCVVLLFTTAIAMAQNVVTGKVTDKSGAPAAGVTVSIKGTKTAVQTSNDGTFSITAPANAKLVFTSVGFATQEVAVNGKTNLTVGLSSANQDLSNVVVIGYGTARKKDLTGSVFAISSKDFQKGAITTPEQLISGKIPGVAITSNSGQPGSGSQIRIRGGSSLTAGNDPLIVLDGVLLDPGGVNGAGNALSLINANDIETFTVLKDASSTAIYGSRASNGVIIITTKKGKDGQLKVNYTTALSISKLIKETSVFNANEIRNIVNNLPASASKTKALSQIGTANTNWQDAIYRTALSTDNNLSLTGGIKKLPYRLSFGYSYNNGILKTDHLQKSALSLNLNPSFLEDHLKVNINLKGIAEETRFGNQGAIGGAVSFDPTQPIYSGNARYGGYYEWLDAAQANGLALNRPNNPVSQLMLTHDMQKPKRSIGNIQLDYKFHALPALHANLNVGYDMARSTGNKYISDSSASSYSSNPATVIGGSNQYGKQTKQSHFLDFYLNYVKDLANMHSKVDATLGYSYNYYEAKTFNYRSLNARGDTFPGSKPPTYLFDKQNNATIGYFGRLVYTYFDKYVLTATLRRDGSSRFAKNNRWGNFPSVAFAWKMKEESFLKNSNLFSDLKLRVGYGKTGQQEGIANYTYFYGFNQANANSAYQMGTSFVQGYAPTAYNPNLKWEVTDAYNVALDYGFFNNRMTGSIDYYVKKTKDLLFNAAQPAGTNFSSIVLANIGKMENKGVEFNLGAAVIKSKDLTWDVNFNFTYNKNTITQLTNQPNSSYLVSANNIPSGGSTSILYYAVGQPVGAYYVYHQVYDANHRPIEGVYEDVNRDGVIDDKDKYLAKTGTPNLFFGYSTYVTYKKWNAGFVLRANFNNYVYNNVFSNSGTLNRLVGAYNTGNLSKNYSETGFATNQSLSDYYLENASFLKMDNLNVGYNFGNVYRKKASLRVSATVQNVFTITKYKGLDPEVVNGIDNNIYPRPRIFTIGANLDF